jgi:hypothetical protein
LLTERPSDAHGDREKIEKARQNAENLFKPRPQPGPGELATASTENAAPAAEQQPRRQPRIFRIPSVAPIKAASAEAPAPPKPRQRRRTIGRTSGAIPASQFGRIRALASYGMTRAQVAELYGVGVDEIERIVRQPNSVLSSEG